MARDYRREHQARNQRAHERGFRTYGVQRRFGRAPSRPVDLGELPDEARDIRAASLAAVQRARREGISVEEAAMREAVPMSAVRWWARDALRPTRVGRTRPTRTDTYLRMHPLVVEGELTFVATRGSRAAARAHDAFAAQWRFIHGQGSGAALARYHGTRIGGHVIETDPAVLVRLARHGAFAEIDDIYRVLLG